ncbi:hypothetical protein RIU93_02510 [Staphylococcus warneri]|uniref:hypothetical protein n=3 Tax=Staphylococcus warneri TaxID=1292 RepID=UPI0007364F9D|nr:hypothetical protein [Staphylococcus warneri]AXZ24053.1 hypothetical protein D3P10_10030 [Staphylococcus warneri]KTW09378.1 hypothetical protein NS346_01220 [Staphylococcus warneri]OIS43594.1 hypothetical protein A4A23_06935 [Staphylococcus warneri]PTI07345.1 hypothetical protein BU088_05285 [Staphylococcus warneri]PTI31231.1 hypothetical protein BU078_12580 [Staphylococcus warneri]
MKSSIKDIIKLEVNYSNMIENDDINNDGIAVRAKNNVEISEDKTIAIIDFDFILKSVKANIWEENKDKEELFKKNEDETIIGKLKVKYKVITELNIIDETKLRFTLLEIVEPYFRKEVETLLSNMKLPNYVLPYRFWENEDK